MVPILIVFGPLVLIAVAAYVGHLLQRPKVGDRVVVSQLGAYRGRVGKVVGLTRKASERYKIEIDTGETLYTGLAKRVPKDRRR